MHVVALSQWFIMRQSDSEFIMVCLHLNDPVRISFLFHHCVMHLLLVIIMDIKPVGDALKHGVPAVLESMNTTSLPYHGLICPFISSWGKSFLFCMPMPNVWVDRTILVRVSSTHIDDVVSGAWRVTDLHRLKRHMETVIPFDWVIQS